MAELPHIRSNAGKDRRKLCRFFVDRRFLAEMHHLLWRPAFENNGQQDAGWMCRDHAFLVAALGALQGFLPVLAHGRAYYVGPTSDGRRLVHKVDPHSWTMFMDASMFDLSPNLESGSIPNWASWPDRAVISGQFYPKAQTKLLFFDYSDRPTWDAAIQRLIDVDGFGAIYLRQEAILFNEALVRNAQKEVSSPLTDELRGLREFDEIYAKAVRHLWDFAHRRCRSLSSFSQRDAWLEISRLPGGTVNWLIEQVFVT